MTDITGDITLDLIVADTNVVVQGMKSLTGASGYILTGMIEGTIRFAMSPAVILEYEEVLNRDEVWQGRKPPQQTIDVVLDVLCDRCVPADLQYTFRPFLNDPDDDLFIDCALAAGARLVVTTDKHFQHPAVQGFGLKAMRPGEYVAELRRERRM